MSFINNPLGSGGTSYQGLGDLTAGVTALQRAEAQRRVAEIQQQKGWEHDEKLANEKWAVEVGSTPMVNDIRVGIAKNALADSENLMKSLTDFQKSYSSLSPSDRLAKKMELTMNMKQILAKNQNASLMATAVEKMNPIILQTRAKLSGAQLEQFDKQLADFHKRLNDPVESLKMTPYDTILAIQPPPPDARTQMASFVKGQRGIFKMNPSIEAKQYDPNATVDALSLQLKADPSLVESVNKTYGIKDPTDVVSAAKAIESQYRGILSKDETAGRYEKPDKLTESEKNAQTTEVPTFVESSDPDVKSGNGVVVRWGAKPLTVTVGTGAETTAAQFVPTQYVGKTVQGKFSGVQYVKKEAVPLGVAQKDKKGDSRIKLENQRTVNGNVVVDATYPEVKEWYGSVPYAQIQDEMKQKAPVVNETYNKEILSEGKKKSAPAKTNKYGI